MLLSVVLRNMIQIKSKYNCCGCSACVQVCPQKCIELKKDNEGFLYPYVKKKDCINCHLCEKVCPMFNPYNRIEPKKILAAFNKDDEVRSQSSSGGIFTLLAENVINHGGIVFGARFDEDWQVILDYTESIHGLASFRGSKYVQAYVGDTYKQCKKFLDEGRDVLFSGTPCQIAGLKHYINKDYSNLLTVACACHGVPSPLVWTWFLNDISKGRGISDIKFRDKSTGWKNYSFTIKFKNGDIYTNDAMKVPYMRAFISSLIERPSCRRCMYKNGCSGADIVLGDNWGIDFCNNKIENDNKGCGLVVAYNNKYITLFDGFGCEIKVAELSEDDVVGNGAFVEYIPQHKRRNLFFLFVNELNCIKLIDFCLSISVFDKIKRKLLLLCKKIM